jgi:hypothetical protein
MSYLALDTETLQPHRPFSRAVACGQQPCIQPRLFVQHEGYMLQSDSPAELQPPSGTTLCDSPCILCTSFKVLECSIIGTILSEGPATHYVLRTGLLP